MGHPWNWIDMAWEAELEDHWRWVLWIPTHFWQSGVNIQEQIYQHIHLASAVFETGRIFANFLLQLVSNITAWTASGEGHWIAGR